MDKSWMTKSRGTKEYRNRCKSFVDYAVRNCRTPDGLIVCPCKMCRNNRKHPPRLVYKHLTGGKRMWPQYQQWIFHSERPVRAPVEGAHLNRSIVDAGESGEQGGNMLSLLRDLFGMHEVREDNCERQVKVEGEEEHIVHDEADECDCVGGVSNTIFSAFLNFINQLLPVNDGALPGNTYEAKRFLRDMGLGYEKIPACRNNCMLFWNGNKDLDLCVKCGESKWKDEIYLDEDGQPITSSKRRPMKVLRWFPIIPQLQRLFMSHHTALHMRWHADGRTKDGVLRHPADSEA
ncbi:uncharacterized protein LOC132174075 [Corylus avellana]|uniref:uncharacterized protein LOC132174075 n=1 Tax=Corylus avellana TaxID=13451 RepID=UPI00286CDBD0|nr:uncharacterized protein LOC132174075 [Corylus avellana]